MGPARLDIPCNAGAFASLQAGVQNVSFSERFSHISPQCPPEMGSWRKWGPKSTMTRGIRNLREPVRDRHHTLADRATKHHATKHHAKRSESNYP